MYGCETWSLILRETTYIDSVREQSAEDKIWI
jgi:hypothetical protein